MLEPRWVRWLSRLVPSDARTDLFEPSYHDLRAAHVRRAGRSSHPRLAAEVLLLVLQCWIALTARPPRPPAHDVHVPNPEPIAMSFYLIRHAFRLLFREPAFTLAAVLTLALGVGANVAVFAVVEAVLLRPFPYPDAGRLVVLNHRDRRTGITKEFIAIGDYLDMAKRQTSFESLAAYGGSNVTVYGMGEPYRATTLGAGPGLLDALKLTPVLGRTLTP